MTYVSSGRHVMRSPGGLRILAVLIVSLAVLAQGEGHTVRVESASPTATMSPVATSPSCDTPLTLTLEPGQHWPGGRTGTLPADMPPGTITVRLPLYPNATLTQEVEAQPTFSYPAVAYLKSASITYHAAADLKSVRAWYQQSFQACGYTLTGYGSSGRSGVELSEGITVSQKGAQNAPAISLSFARAADGGTLILYIALAVTPPQYPVAGSVLRVPGTPVAVTITQYSGMNSGALRPLRSTDVHDPVTAASLADEINHLPKVIGIFSCPMDDGSHDTLVFRDADGSSHPVRIDLRGCRDVVAPGAPAGRLWDDPHLLPRINALLKGTGGRQIPYPYDARTLHPVRVRQLGAVPGRFLSTGQNGSHLLYLSRGNLLMAPATGGAPQLLARGIADASLGIDDQVALARPSGSSATNLRLIDTRTHSSRPFPLPSGSTLIGRDAGLGPAGLSDAMACQPAYVWYIHGRHIEAIDPEHSVHDRFHSAGFLPAHRQHQLLAISCSGGQIAIYQPRKGLVVREIGFDEGSGGRLIRRIANGNINFLSWAPDDRHLAYRSGSAVSVLDVQTGAVRPLLRLGRDVIHGAAWDPWSHVLALAVTPHGAPLSASRVILADVNGQATGRLPLPFTGATTLTWSTWKGETIGITRVTNHGTEAWAISLPSLPADPGVSIGG